MSRVYAAAFETVDEAAVRGQVFHHYAQVRLVEYVKDLVQGLLNGFVQQALVLYDGLNLQRHVADNHGEGEILHRPCSGHGLEPFALGVGATLQDALEGAAGDIGIMLVSRGYRQLGEGHAGEGVGENVVWGDEGFSFPGEGEVEVVVAVVAELFQEIGPLLGAGQPGFILFYLIIKHGEHPYFPALQPDEFVCVKDAAVAVQAGEVSAKFLILGLFQPEGEHAPVKLFAVPLRHGCEVNIFHVGLVMV